MSSTQDRSVVDDEATTSQTSPSTTVATSTVNVVGDKINQVFLISAIFFIFYREF
jgi:hypothetical protein